MGEYYYYIYLYLYFPFNYIINKIKNQIVIGNRERRFNLYAREKRLRQNKKDGWTGPEPRLNHHSISFTSFLYIYIYTSATCNILSSPIHINITTFLYISC